MSNLCRLVSRAPTIPKLINLLQNCHILNIYQCLNLFYARRFFHNSVFIYFSITQTSCCLNVRRLDYSDSPAATEVIRWLFRDDRFDTTVRLMVAPTCMLITHICMSRRASRCHQKLPQGQNVTQVLA